MPSVHDPLLHLLRGDPAPLIHLLRARRLDLPITGWAPASEAFSRAALPERRPDLVLVHPDVDLVLVLEIQGRVDPRKTRTWPYYAAAAALRYGRDAALIVLTLRRAVAAWARELPPQPWGTFRPIVLGPDELVAHDATPALAVLAALAGGARDRRLIERALRLIAPVDNDARTAYLDLLCEQLPHAMADILEVMMSQAREPSAAYRSLIEQFSRMVGKEEGKIEGKIEGAADRVRAHIVDLLARLGRAVPDLDALELYDLEQLYERLLDEAIPAREP